MIPDLHLFSSKIGGNWSKDSFTIFIEKFLPRMKQENPDMIVFLGDTLDPGNLKWDEGDAKSILFVDAIKSINMEHIYSLLGNHERKAPLDAISKMGGPKFIDDKWIDFKDKGIGFYFFSTRYEYRHNMQKVIYDMRSIEENHLVKTKILFMHDGLSIIGEKNNIPEDIMTDISKNFDAIFNGHQHFYEEYDDNIWCLDSALPWRVTLRGTKKIDLNQANIIDAWDYGPESPIFIYDGANLETAKDKYRNRYGFYIFDTEKRKLDHINIDIGIDIVNIRLIYNNASADLINSQLMEIYNKLEKDKQKTIVRLYLEGTLREGERIDLDIIKNDYYYKFYEEKNENIVNTKKLKIKDMDFSEENLGNFVSIEDALTILERERPYIKIKWEDNIGQDKKSLQELMRLKSLFANTSTGFDRLLSKLRTLKPIYYDILKVKKYEN